MSALISPLELKRKLPLSSDAAQFVAASKQLAKKVLRRTDPRLVCITGPCSIHDPSSALEYASRLKRLSLEVAHSFFLVMRVFCEKPRTRAGWKGFIYDPNLDGSFDIEKGLTETRRLFLSLTNLEIPIATEFLDPLIAPYFDDLITWGFIGARTSASQPHRQLASSFSFPIGFKNSIYGEMGAALHGIYNARGSHVYFGINSKGSLSKLESKGNPWTHLVLRGSEKSPNYDEDSIGYATSELKRHNLEPHLLVDCSHGNSKKDHRNQSTVFRNVFAQFKKGSEALSGVMLESNLYEGNQPHPEDPSSLNYGLSITDSCMGWEETEELLLEASFPTSISSVQS